MLLHAVFWKQSTLSRGATLGTERCQVLKGTKTADHNLRRKGADLEPKPYVTEYQSISFQYETVLESEIVDPVLILKKLGLQAVK